MPIAPGQPRSVQARRILSPTSGFIAEAGFTHSLNPARNCTFGCTYCYVPTLGIYGGLMPDDVRHWRQFTTFKTNAAELLRRELHAHHRIYCSPLGRPHQPAEAAGPHMPRILEAVLDAPPRVFVLQTQGPLILPDLDRLRRLALRTTLRVSFSVTTNREDVRRLYEPHCAPIAERLEVIRTLRDAGIETYATLAPLLPCDPLLTLEASRDLTGDPLHVRAVKRHGATTREAALRVSAAHGFDPWLDAEFQAGIVDRIRAAAQSMGCGFATGPVGFGKLAA